MEKYWNDATETAMTEIMCYKCLAKAGLSVLALEKLGYLSGDLLSDPLTFLKPFVVIFSATLVVDFVFKENFFGTEAVAKKT